MNEFFSTNLGVAVILLGQTLAVVGFVMISLLFLVYGDRKIWAAVQVAQMYLPIHNQVLNWGMRKDIMFDVQPEDTPLFQFLTFK